MRHTKWKGWVPKVVLLAGLTLVAGSTVALWQGFLAFLSSPHVALETYDVTGTVRLSKDAVTTWSGLVKGTPYGDINEDAVATRLMQHPWIREASVRRGFPSSVTMNIQEWVPGAVAVGPRSFLVDEQGQIFKSYEVEDYELDLPLIVGLGPDRLMALVSPEESEAKASARGVLNAALDLSRVCGRLSQADGSKVVEIRWEDGVGFEVVTADGMIAQLGRGRLEEKVERVVKVAGLLRGKGQAVNRVYLSSERRPDWVTVAGPALRRTSAGGGRGELRDIPAAPIPEEMMP
jgi:cell division protein FtsQ